MKDGKADSTFVMTVEVLKASGDMGVRMVADLLSTIVKEGVIPDS